MLTMSLPRETSSTIFQDIGRKNYENMTNFGIQYAWYSSIHKLLILTHKQPHQKRKLKALSKLIFQISNSRCPTRISVSSNNMLFVILFQKLFNLHQAVHKSIFAHRLNWFLALINYNLMTTSINPKRRIIGFCHLFSPKVSWHQDRY